MRQANGTVLFSWPLAQHIITAGWLYSGGSTHHALDFRAAVGVPVYAVESGTVDWVQYWDGKTKTGNQSYGNLVRIVHQTYNGQRLQTYYAHLNSISVKNGQLVKEGQIIGYAGNTGNSFGSHLHFEVRLNSNRVNPLNWFNDDFSTANSSVILGTYTSVKRLDNNAIENLTSDTFKIGPAGNGDKNTIKTLADSLGINAEIEGDYVIVGPMSGNDRLTIANKALSLNLGCIDYKKEDENIGGGNLMSDTFKIGPAGTNDKAAVKQLADSLGINNFMEGDFIIVGPMSGKDKDTIYEKANSLQLGCIDYVKEEPKPEPEPDPVEPTNPDYSALTELLQKINDNLSLILANQNEFKDKVAQLEKQVAEVKEAVEDVDSDVFDISDKFVEAAKVFLM